MGIQPRNATTAQGALQRLQALGPTGAGQPGYNPQAARLKRSADIWGSGQKGAPNYNPYMDRNNPMNQTSGAGVMGQWRGHTQGLDTPAERAMYGLGGTGPTAAMRKSDQDRVNLAQQWRDKARNRYMPQGNMQMGGAIGEALAAQRQRQTGNPNQTPPIYVPGEEPAPPSDDPTPPSNLLGSTPKDVVTEISAPPTGMSSENPLMNTLKPKQKPKFGTLGANRGMNGMGLGPNSVAKPGVYGTYGSTSGYMPVSEETQKQFPNRSW